MQRAQVDAPRTLRLDLYDDDGALVDDTTTATVAVVDAAGTGLAGSPFSASGTASGHLEANLPPVAVLGVYDLDWTITRPGGVEHRSGELEVVGGYLYGIGELRARWSDYADPEVWPVERLRANRDAVEDLFDHYCRPALRRRARTVTVDGSGRSDLTLPDLYPRALTAVTIDDVALTGDELADLVVYETGTVHRVDAWPAGYRNVVVTYDHGLGQVPADVHEAALQLARATLTAPAAPDRATSVSTDAGNFRLTVAGKDGPTGLPVVDAVLDRWGATQRLHAL